MRDSASPPEVVGIPTSGLVSFPGAAEIPARIPATLQGRRRPSKGFGNLGKPWEISRFLARYPGSSQGTVAPCKDPKDPKGLEGFGQFADEHVRVHVGRFERGVAIRDEHGPAQVLLGEPAHAHERAGFRASRECARVRV